MMHSGRQFGGAPSIPAKQEHTGLPSISLQSAFNPQGEGMQGVLGVTSTLGTETIDKNY